MAFSGSFEQFGAKAPGRRTSSLVIIEAEPANAKKSSLQGWINEQTETFFCAKKRVQTTSDQVRSG